MNTFQVKHGHYLLNGQPQLIQAGEFHYFRTPADAWTHRLELLKRAGFNAVAAYIPWLWHQPEQGISDVDGHTHPMRNLAGFLDLAAEMGLYVIARPGPYIMAETINEGIPPWVFRQYPQAAFVSHDGKTQNIASYLHPDFLHCVEDWYQAVFQVLTPRQITHGGTILMVQLDNEMGMIQWVRNIVDINPDTLDRFARYLMQTYGDHIAHRYPAANLTDFLQIQITQPEAAYGAAVIEDYRRFYRGYLRDYAAHLWDRARAHGMDVPPVINIHGFGNGGKTFPIGLSQLVEVMAIPDMVSATDVYPIFISEGNFHQLVLVNEMTKALQNPHQALFSIEFQAGGNPDFGNGQSSLFDLHSRLCISCGMRAINHYLFFDGENDPILSPVKRHDWGHPVRKDGTLRRHYARYPKLSAVLSAYGSDLVRARATTVTTIGFLLDVFMTEVNNNFTRSQTDLLTHQRDTILFDFIARGLALTHRPFDAVDLTRASLDSARTPVLWVMLEKQCDAVVQQKLVDYARQGGKLILVGRMCEESFDHAPCHILRDAFGVQSALSDPPFTSTRITAFNYQDVPVSFMETYTGDFDEIFATSTEGKPVGWIKHVGGGQVMMLGAALAANTLEDVDILNQMANRFGCAPMFTMTDWVDARLSEGDNGSFLFVNNYQDDSVETRISLAGEFLFGGHPLILPARRGAILPLHWPVKPGIVIDYITSEPIAVIDDESGITIKTEQSEFFAQLHISGYHCDPSIITEHVDDHWVNLHGTHGEIRLTRT